MNWKKLETFKEISKYSELLSYCRETFASPKVQIFISWFFFEKLLFWFEEQDAKKHVIKATIKGLLRQEADEASVDPLIL